MALENLKSVFTEGITDFLSTDLTTLGGAHIDMPVLVVVREENQQINTTVKALVDSLPDSKLMKIDSIGHSMYMENPDMVAQIAREWFA